MKTMYFGRIAIRYRSMPSSQIHTNIDGDNGFVPSSPQDIV